MVHAPGRAGGVVLSLSMCLSALVLGVTLYAITRDEDPDLAMLGLTCRVGEGLLGTMLMPARLAVLSLGTDATLNAETVRTLGAFVSSTRSLNTLLGATLFAVGSTLFSWLLLRGRMIPVVLAWLGVLASLLLVVGLPLQLAGVLRGPVTAIMWLPMLAFEVPLALWLLVRGVRTTGR